MRRTGQKLLKFDRKLGARFVAGADEAGRGSLAGPLVVAGVLLDYEALKEHRVRPLTYLNDSKQCSEERREALYHAVLGCAEKIAVRLIPAREIDRNGLHRWRRSTPPSSTATRRAPRSRRPRSSPR